MILTFADFELDPERFELRRAGEPVRIEPRVLEVLLYLAAHRERVVSKDELIAEVWRVKFVSESALARCVHEARRVLGDEGRREKVIKTIYGRGYRFLVEVEERASPGRPVDAGANIGPDAPEGAGDEQPARPRDGASGAAPDEPRPARLAASPERPRTSVPRHLAVAIAATVLAMSVLWLLATRLGERHRLRAAATPRFPALGQLTSGIQDALKPAFSPDGATLLFVAQEPEMPGVLDLYLMPAAGGRASRITRGAAVSGDLPAFTADGSEIVFSRFRGGEDGSRLPDLWTVSRFGGEPRLFLEQASGAGFSPDGEWVAYTKHAHAKTPLWVGRVRAPGEHRELSPSGFAPRWSPDGRWIAFTTSDPQGGLGQLWIVSPESGERRRLTEEAQQMYGLAWARDSRSVIFAASRASLFHLFQVTTSGGYVAPLTTGLGEYSAPAVAPDGKTLVFCHSRPVYALASVQGLASTEVSEIAQPEHHLWPRLSPSSGKVASVIQRPDHDDALYLTDLGGRSQVRLSDHPARHPCWISDDVIGYLAPDRAGKRTELRVVNPATLMRFSWTTFTGDAGWVAVHPDKTRIAVVMRSPNGGQRIVLRNLADLQETTLAAGAQYECLRWLPDGKAVSWSGPRDSGDRESNGVWMTAVDIAHPTQLASDGYGPCWSPDGRTVYFSRIGADAGLWQLELASRRLTRLRAWDDVTSFDIAGERLFYVRNAGRSQIYSMPLDQ
ncbi:MAG: winged helix-turn-helix domain-containing protein [Acidobacteriota bacterium]